MWTPPSRQQIESNANPYRALTSEQVRQNAHKAWKEAADKKLKDQYTWDAKKGKYVRLDGEKTPFDDLEDQYTWDEKSGKYVRLDGETGIVEESVDLSEGGVKAALEDYMYSIPKAAIEELKPIMKQKASTKKFGQITKILKKHGFTDKFMGSYPANVVNDYFDTFFGESTELDEVSPPGWEGTVKAMKKKKEIDNPWALAWWMKGKGYKSHRKEDGTKKESVELGEQEKAIKSDKVDPEGYYAVYKDGGKLKVAGPYSTESAATDYNYEGLVDVLDGAELVKSRYKAISVVKESVELGEASESIKKVKKMGFQTLYQFGGKYYIVSTSPMADETAIFNSDKNGDVKDYREIWSERERVSHDYAIKDYIDNKFKAFGVKIESVCGCDEKIDESHTRAELEKLSISKLRELMKEYDKKAANGDDDAARELADIRGILRSRGAGSVVEENLQERSIADMAAEIIPIKHRGPSMKPKKVTAIKLVLPDTPDIKKKMKAVMDKDATFRRKMLDLVIDREERSNGELVLHFASFRGREKFSEMMNDAAK